MIALPNMTVPTQFQAPPPLPQSGQGDGSFSDHFANAATLNFNAPNTLNGSTALSTSLPPRKTAAQNDNTNNNGSTPQSPSIPFATAASPNTQAAPISVAGQTSSTSDGHPPGTGGTGTLATTVAAATNGAAHTAQGQLAVPLGNGTTIALGAQGKTAFIAQFADLVGNTGNQASPNQTSGVPLSSGTTPVHNAANQTGIAVLLAAQGRASVVNGTSAANQPALPRGLPTGPMAGQTATPASGQFGTLRATSTANQSAGNSIVVTTSQVGAATADQSSPQSAAAFAAQADASSAKPGADSNPTPPGAAELNARIVAGATMLAAHPSTALTSAAKDLLQPSNPNAGTTPPNPATVNARAEKASDDRASNVPGSANAAASTGIAPTPSTAPPDPRSITSTLTRPPTQAHDAAQDVSTINAQPVNAATNDMNTALSSASSSNTTPSSAPANATSSAANSTAPDVAARQSLMGIPAGEQVAINLKQAIKDGSNDIHIQLKPDSLGAIDVKLNVNHEGRLTAVISADRSDTLNLLRQDSGSLQQSLRDAGFSADSGSLSFNLRGDSQSFAQNAAQQGNTSGPAISRIDDSIAAVPVYASRQTSGTIDIQA